MLSLECFLKELCPQSQKAWWRWPGSQQQEPSRQNLRAGCPRQIPSCSCPVRPREQRPAGKVRRVFLQEKTAANHGTSATFPAVIPSPAACSS